MENSLQTQLIVCTVSMTDPTVSIQACGSFLPNLSVFIAFIVRVIHRYAVWAKCSFVMLTLLRYIAVTLFESFRCGNFH